MNETLASAKEIQLELRLPEKLPTVMADYHCLEQVINNLISNAVKFSKPKTKVAIVAIARRDQVEISVADEGLGICKEEMGELFKPFSHLRNRSTGQETSTGPGLAIVKKIIELHKGRIRAESEVGKGSTFTFTLPLVSS